MQKSNQNTNIRILYVVNFYGTPPLNFLSKYLAENTDYKLTVIKLPSVSLSKSGIEYEAFVLDEVGQKTTLKFRSSLKIPSYMAFMLQYILNTYAACKLTRNRGVFDLGIGETSFGSFVMWIYKILGRVHKTVFMSGDVLPIFDRKIKPYYLNSDNAIIKLVDKIFVLIQLLLRKVGIKNDVVWYANQKTREWDLENGLTAKSYFVAPAVTIDKNESLENLKTVRNENSLAYIGRLDANAGVDVALEALALMVKAMPNVKITFVGGSETAVKKYQEMAKQLNIESNVDFKGFVEKTEDAIKIIRQAKIGLALYKPEKENVSMYADVSKPKEYLRAGLPVIMTNGGPSLGDELQDLGAGVLANFDSVDIAKTLVDVLSDNNRYNNLLKGVTDAAEKYDYRENFRKVFENIQNKI